jgi:hypothetical protein
MTEDEREQSGQSYRASCPLAEDGDYAEQHEPDRTEFPARLKVGISQSSTGRSTRR